MQASSASSLTSILKYALMHFRKVTKCFATEYKMLCSASCLYGVHYSIARSQQRPTINARDRAKLYVHYIRVV